MNFFRISGLFYPCDLPKRLELHTQQHSVSSQKTCATVRVSNVALLRATDHPRSAQTHNPHHLL